MNLQGNTQSRAGWKVTTLRIIMVFIVLSCYGTAVWFGGKTLTHVYIPWIISGAIGVVTGTFMWSRWERITSIRMFLPNFIIHVAIATGILAGMIFTLNYTFSQKSTAITADAMVIEKYSETKHHSRRVGRGRYVQGTPYQAYYAKVKIPAKESDETSMIPTPRYLSINVTLSQYNRIKTGKTMKVEIEKGLFGLPVLKSHLHF